MARRESVWQDATVSVKCKVLSKVQVFHLSKMQVKEGIKNVLLQLSRKVDGDEIRMQTIPLNEMDWLDCEKTISFN